MPLSGKQERDPASASLHASWSYYQDRTTLQGGSRPKSNVQTTVEQFLEKRSCSLLVIFPLTHSLLTLLLTESICTTLPREILQSSASRFNGHGGRKRVTHSNCISAATGIAPNPQSLKNKNHSAQLMCGLHASCTGTVEPSAGISKGTQPPTALPTAENTRVLSPRSYPPQPFVNLLFYRKPG